METFSNTSIKGADINLKLGLVASDSLKRAYCTQGLIGVFDIKPLPLVSFRPLM